MPGQLAKNLVEDLEVKEGNVERLLLLAMLLKEKSCHVNCIGHSAAFHEASLVDSVLDVYNPPAEGTFKYI